MKRFFSIALIPYFFPRNSAVIKIFSTIKAADFLGLAATRLSESPRLDRLLSMDLSGHSRGVFNSLFGLFFFSDSFRITAGVKKPVMVRIVYFFRNAGLAGLDTFLTAVADHFGSPYKDTQSFRQSVFTTVPFSTLTIRNISPFSLRIMSRFFSSSCSAVKHGSTIPFSNTQRLIGLVCVNLGGSVASAIDAKKNTAAGKSRFHISAPFQFESCPGQNCPTCRR